MAARPLMPGSRTSSTMASGRSRIGGFQSLLGRRRRGGTVAELLGQLAQSLQMLGSSSTISRWAME